MWSLTLKSLRLGWARLAACYLILTIAGAALTIALILPGILRSTASDVVSRDAADAAYVITLNADANPYDALHDVSQAAPSAQLDTTGSIEIEYPHGEQDTELFSSVVDAPFQRSPVVTGRVPDNPGEVALTVAQARTHKSTIGSQIKVRLPLNSGETSSLIESAAKSAADRLGMTAECVENQCWLTTELSVVGLTASTPQFLGGFDRMVLSRQDVDSWLDSPSAWAHQNRILISHADAAAHSLDFATVSKLIPDALKIQNSADIRWAADQVTAHRSLTPSAVFALLSTLLLLVALLFVGNIFYTRVIKQTPDFIRLRHIGAQPAHLITIVRRQALIIGIAAGLSGLLAGGSLVSAVVAYLLNNPALASPRTSGIGQIVFSSSVLDWDVTTWDTPLDSASWPLLALIASPVVCTVIALIAGYRPARLVAEMGSSPRNNPPAVPPASELHPGGWGKRRVMALALMIVPVIVLAIVGLIGPTAPVLHTKHTNLPWTAYLAIACALLFFAGLILFMPMISARTAGGILRLLIGLLPERLRPTAHLSLGYIQSFPRRTAAAAAAFAVTVGAAMGLSTATATVNHSVSNHLNNVFSFDLEVYPPAGLSLDPDRLLAQVRSVPGITDAVIAQRTYLTIRHDSIQRQIPVLGVNPVDAAIIARDPHVPATLGKGILLAGHDCMLPKDVTQVEVLTKGSDELAPWHTQTLDVIHVNAWMTALVSTEQFIDFQAQHSTPVILASVSDQEYTQTPALVQALFTPHQSTPSAFTRPAEARAEIGGGAPILASLDQLISKLHLVVTGILVAAMLIAFVGVGGSLIVSASQRNKENALLHSLGMKLRHVFASVTLECVALFSAGIAVGIISGISIGALCGWMIMRSIGTPPVLEFPWESLRILLLGSILGVF